jgi:hypothetical protein
VTIVAKSAPLLVVQSGAMWAVQKVEHWAARGGAAREDWWGVHWAPSTVVLTDNDWVAQWVPLLAERLVGTMAVS